MSKGFDTPSNKHLGNSHDYWKAPQNNSKQIVVQSLQWLPIDRDENGFATEVCLKDIHKRFNRKQPIMFVVKDKDGIAYECLSPTHDIYDWIGDIELHPCFTHYLPIPKLEV